MSSEADRGQRQLAMLHAISSLLSGAHSISETMVEIAARAKDILECDRIVVLVLEPPDTWRVHAASSTDAWNEGRTIHRDEASPRLWSDAKEPEILSDITQV